MSAIVKRFSSWSFVSIVLLAAACAQRAVEVPVPETRSIGAVIAERSYIERMDARLSVVFQKVDSEMYGDAVLDVARSGDMHMKVYSLGILGMELSSKGGVVKSNPRLDTAKKTILTKGLRDSLYWWDLQDAATAEDGELLVLRNATRTVWLDRATLLPVRQQISFDDGKQLNIAYDSPVREGGIWYPSRMRIELTRYAVILQVKELVLNRKD